MAVLAVTLSGCDTHRYYQLSALNDVAEIDVVTNLSEPAGNIVKPEQVAAITAFMNARLDHWYDSHGVGFGMTGNLVFLDARHKRIAYISFGTGGMYQTRPNMTYTDLVKQREFQVTRNPPPEQGANDKAELCGLLGSRFDRAVCDVHYRRRFEQAARAASTPWMRSKFKPMGNIAQAFYWFIDVDCSKY